jgi:hypothetical protein
MKAGHKLPPLHQAPPGCASMRVAIGHRASSGRAPDGRGCLGDGALVRLLQRRCPLVPSCGEYLSFPGLLPLIQTLSFLHLCSFQIPQLVFAIMSETSVKLKTPETGEYEQPTGL